MTKPTFTVIKTGPRVSGKNLEICQAIIVDQAFKYAEYVNSTEAVKKGLGIINPSNGFVIETPTGEVVTNYMQLFRYMERKGLVRL